MWRAASDALLPSIDGYLGTGALKAKRIEIDFEGEAHALAMISRPAE